MAERRGGAERRTGETAVKVALDLSGGTFRASTGIGFFEHMLEQLSRHAGIGLEVEAKGDLHVDAHHTVEDVGLAIGEALDRALGDRTGVERFGFAFAPLDEALARAVVDLSGRAYCRYDLAREVATAFVTQGFPLTLVGEFWRAVATRARLTMHLDLERASDPHHAAEALFKAAALALRQAVRITGEAVPSTKGTLS